MPKHVLRDCRVEVNSVVLSDHANAVTIEASRPEVEVTAMGSAFQEFTPGIPDGTITVTFLQDYDAAKVDATIWPLISSATPVNVNIRTTSGAISATNPEFQMSALVYSYSPISGDLGSPNTTEVTFRNASSTGIVRDTTP
ncbi:MAG TPA: hypothetical protein VH950_05075 [Gaiellaceae bacterium]|jgi:hypothetical protein